MKVCIIANPIAGGGKGESRARELASALSARGHQPEVLLTQAAGHAETLAAERRDAGFDCLVATGGDGTLNEMVNGLGDSQIPFSVLAVGTANVVARQFRIPKQPEALADVVHRMRVEPMDLGLAQGRRFLLGAGAGLDAAITARVKALRGRTSSVWIWVRPSLETIWRYTNPCITVEVDGKLISDSAHYAIVGNCIYSAGVFPATPRACTKDGLLDVCLIHDISALKCVDLFFGVWRSSFTQRKDVRYVQGRDISFTASGAEAAFLQIDGDPAGQVPCHFGVLPRAARIVVP